MGAIMGHLVALWGNHGTVMWQAWAFGGIMGMLWGRYGAIMGYLKGIKGLPPPVDIYILVLGLVARENCTILKLGGWDTI